MAIFSDEKSVLPLSARFPIASFCCPLVLWIDVCRSRSSVDHWLNGKGHPFSERNADLIQVVRNLGCFVKVGPGSVPYELVDDATALGFGIRLDYFRYFANEDSGFQDAY